METEQDMESQEQPPSKRIKLDIPSLIPNEPSTPLHPSAPTEHLLHGHPMAVTSPTSVPLPSNTPHQTMIPTGDDIGYDEGYDGNSLCIIYRASENQIKDFVENVCTEDQRERYYAFRRIRFHHPSIRKLSTAVTGTTAPKSLPLVISALSRTYISQIIDLARKAMQEQGVSPSTPLSPLYLKEGYRRYHAKCRETGSVSFMPRPRLF